MFLFPAVGNVTSMMGQEARTRSSTLVSPEELTVAKYRIAYLAETVLPAPDSPLTMMDWFLSSLHEKVIIYLISAQAT